MTLSISENRTEGVDLRRAVFSYVGISVFCIIFFLVYNQFSHGVHSPFMTWLFGWPLVFGVIPCLVLDKCRRFHSPGRISFNVWNSGVAALTVSSLLRGIFEIAGTGSDYQEWLMAAGGIMVAAGAIAYIIRK